MIEAAGLTKTFNGTKALDALDLIVPPGEIFCLLGPNGAGKTTAINLFLGFIPPTAGTARVKGVDVSVDPLADRRHLAYIPEQVMLYRNLTGLENLGFFSGLSGRDYSPQELGTFLVQAGLPPEAAGRRVGTYSKGMRQKVGIAIALAKGAEALLLDEPTSGLDPKASSEFSEILKRLSGQGVAILMATHDLFRALDVGTRLGIMARGRLVSVLRSDETSHAGLEEIYLQQIRD